MLIWITLPLYVINKRYSLAIESFISEVASYTFIAVMAKHNFRAALFTLILPLIMMRVRMVIGNWDHALVDAADPDSSFQSSIMLIRLIDVGHVVSIR